MYGLPYAYRPTLKVMSPEAVSLLPGEVLRKLRQARKLSLRDAAKLSEGAVTYGHIREIEATPGMANNLTMGTMQGLARAYSVPIEHIASIVSGGTQTPLPIPNVRQPNTEEQFRDAIAGAAIPLTKKINVYAAGTGPAWDYNEILEVIYLPEEVGRGLDLVGLKAMGNSMEPYLSAGDIAIIALDDGLCEPGDFCGVWLADNGVVIKRFVKELERGELLLESLHPGRDERFLVATLGSRVIGKVIRRVLGG